MVESHTFDEVEEFPWERLKSELGAFRAARQEPRPPKRPAPQPERGEWRASAEPSLPDLLRGAAEEIREAEARARAVAERHTEEIRTLDARARAAEEGLAHLQQRAVAALREAEHRIRTAEDRAAAAEEALRRVREAMSVVSSALAAADQGSRS